ncbi:MAG TPA: DNA mismatch repair protein [Polyangiaceae bacterium]|nr:DNA mismatch repair protein [Polyangiaceae bacterium]
MPVIPDLLHAEPRLWVRDAELRQMLTFAFASGSGSDAFERALEHMELAPSRFVPDCFSKDLFVEELVARCFQFSNGARRIKPRRRSLVPLITRPPDDERTLAFRHGILAELVEKPELAAALERTWAAVEDVFAALEGSERGRHQVRIERRLEILRAASTAFDVIAASFTGARSGLDRLARFAKEIVNSEAYKNLTELLDHEGHLASVDVRLKLAHDGRLRGFEIVRIAENKFNRYHVSPFGRWLGRLKRFLFGYVIREDEVLGRLIQHVFDGIEPALVALFQLRRDLEFYLAALGFKAFAEQKGLVVCLPTMRAVEPNAPRPDSRFEALYNPLLLLEEHAPRPTDLVLGGSALLLVTGPNSGGKTRLLQAIGHAQLLAQAGFFVAAKSADLPHRHGLFVSVVEEAAADAREGRLGTELLRIRRLFEKLDFGSLVVVDELCSGTNPSEAEEIFRLVVDLLAEIEPQTVVTTHFLHFAAALEAERPVPRLEFLQVELDASQAPTFGFVPGVATTSLARRTAERLGVTKEALRELVDRSKRSRASLSPGPERPG